jgi:nucleoside-diphosphate-sugar epimerase
MGKGGFRISGGDRMNILLAGGASPLGIHLTKHLTNRGHQCHVYDINPTNFSCLTCLSFKQGDVANFTQLQKFAKKTNPDVIVNMASVVLGECFISPQKEVDACIKGSINCIKVAKDIPFVYISTSEVYGQVPVPMHELRDCNPPTPYGAIKYAGELITKTLTDNYMIIRPFNFYGPHMREDKYATIITKALQGATKDIPVPIYDSLNYTRDWTYIDDMGFSVALALENITRFNKIINICSEKETSIKTVLGLVEAATNKCLTLKLLPRRQGDIRRMKGSCGQFSSVTNYMPSTSLEEGIKKYLKWRCEHGY